MVPKLRDFGRHRMTGILDSGMTKETRLVLVMPDVIRHPVDNNT